MNHSPKKPEKLRFPIPFPPKTKESINQKKTKQQPRPKKVRQEATETQNTKYKTREDKNKYNTRKQKNNNRKALLKKVEKNKIKAKASTISV
jgi:hypothetical protein